MMAEFKRGISDKFISALQKLSERDGWWRDVLSDNNLIIAVRDECLNVYWLGQSIFRVAMPNDGAIVATIHPKFLLDPDTSKQVSFDGKRFELAPFEASALIHTYEPGKTLDKLKRAAGLFAGDEKRGVHNIVTSNDSVVDVEIEMQAGDVPNVGSSPRPDIATFEEAKRGVRLVFWEAKTFYNPELRPTRKKNVGDQIKKYKAVVAALRPSIIKSYTCVAKNLIAIADMSGGHRKYNKSVRKVALGDAELTVDPADIGLIVFGFDKAQRDYVSKPLRKRLVKQIEPTQIIDSGKTKGLRIYLRH